LRKALGEELTRQQGSWDACLKPEFRVKPKGEGKLEAARDYEFFLTTFPNLSFVSMGLGVARRAADLRADYRFRTPDAIQLAAALVQGATAFLTNDKKLKPVSEVEVLILDDWVPIFLTTLFLQTHLLHDFTRQTSTVDSFLKEIAV
jgi:hypothetical protein